MTKVLFAAAMAATAASICAAPASAVTLEQARANCRGQYAGSAGFQEARRTGVTIAQRVQQCVHKAMSENKKHKK